MPQYTLEGVWPATALPFDDNASVAWDRFAEHCSWMVEEGCAGVVVNGSLGEYEALSHGERAKVVEVAAEAVGASRVVPGVSGKSGGEALEWTEHAAEVGCPAVMCLPPTSHAPTVSEVVAHFTRVATAGVPIIAYNNPFSTRIDLVPEVVAAIRDAVPEVVGIKEFSTDVRRVAQLLDVVNGLQVICGCDDVLVESVLMGARGWIAGFVNVFPAQSVRLYEDALAGNFDQALPLYREMLPILKWDADPRFIQAIKIGQEMIGRYGGPCRLPRLALSAEDEKVVRAAVDRALAAHH